MRLRTFIAAIICVPSLLGAEILETADGRRIELNENGTYRWLDVAVDTPALKQAEPFFEHHAGEFNQNSIRFMPILINETEVTIVGFKFDTTFTSAFGDPVFSFSGESSERIEPGNESTSQMFYFFEDNQFIAGQPYDKLKIFEASGTGRINTEVTAVVFDDGEVWQARP